MTEPIRYADADPVEVWAFRALMLDARPPVAQVVEDATPETATYRCLTSADLLSDEHLLRETFGLLVLAHYRTEPTDLARLLDAPNLTVRALTERGHVVAVALLAQEGALDAETRERMYEGGRIRGNMIPDVLTTQLRDRDAGVPVGQRVLRIATHGAVRSRGLGSTLLSEIRREFAEEMDWLGVGFGATPELLDFWRANGYRTLHLSTSRNDRSGEYSAVMMDPCSDAGRELSARHSGWFCDRIGATLTDALDDAEPDVVRGALAAAEAEPGLDLSAWEWRSSPASRLARPSSIRTRPRSAGSHSGTSWPWPSLTPCRPARSDCSSGRCYKPARGAMSPTGWTSSPSASASGPSAERSKR